MAKRLYSPELLSDLTSGQKFSKITLCAKVFYGQQCHITATISVTLRKCISEIYMAM